MEKGIQSVAIAVSRPVEEKDEERLRSKAVKDAQRLLSSGIFGLINIGFYELRPRPLSPERTARTKWRVDDYERMQTGQFATIYEFDISDPVRSYDGIKSQLELTPTGIEVVYEGLFTYQVDLHPESFDKSRDYDTHGILLAMTHPLDEKAYEEWYVPIHLDDERIHGIHHSVTRFINVLPGVVPKSMVILETDWKSITEARQEIQQKYVPHFRWPPRPVNEVFAASEYQKIS
jgi:hypothetical protein